MTQTITVAWVSLAIINLFREGVPRKMLPTNRRRQMRRQLDFIFMPPSYSHYIYLYYIYTMSAYMFISSQIAFGISSGRRINFDLETKRAKPPRLRRRLISRSVVFILILTQPWQRAPPIRYCGANPLINRSSDRISAWVTFG